MPAGGARVRAGRAPEMDAFRRDRPSDKATWTNLPASREGPSPRWPLPTPPGPGARKLWRALWREPEAVMWEAGGQEVQVALYVLAVLAAESPKANASDRKTALSYMDDLGLSNGGRARNRWRRSHDAGTQPESAGPSKPGRDRSERSALLELVVDNGEA